MSNYPNNPQGGSFTGPGYTVAAARDTKNQIECLEMVKAVREKAELHWKASGSLLQARKDEMWVLRRRPLPRGNCDLVLYMQAIDTNAGIDHESETLFQELRMVAHEGVQGSWPRIVKCGGGGTSRRFRVCFIRVRSTHHDMDWRFVNAVSDEEYWSSPPSSPVRLDESGDVIMKDRGSWWNPWAD